MVHPRPGGDVSAGLLGVQIDGKARQINLGNTGGRGATGGLGMKLWQAIGCWAHLLSELKSPVSSRLLIGALAT